MATEASSGDATPNVNQTTLSSFEYVLSRPPIFQSLFDQIPTETILQLYHTSRYLRDSTRKTPASWRHISFRLSQPSANAAAAASHNAANGGRQQSNYSLDQLLIAVVNPWSTRLASIELDNTSISGATITQTILNFRRETLLHLSVRGCKNVSLKYHINPWLHMHALAQSVPEDQRVAPFDTLALKSLYTYRCRHHRRRPYLPSSLVRKESDSEPTHELVKTCHLLRIWTDTAWCTTPGARCYRRRGYVTMRVPQDPREVWVVYDRLWRSRNWLGPLDHSMNTDLLQRKRKRDCRFWENDEEAINGEPVGVKGEGKAVPTHERQSHKRFTDNVKCSACDEPILERCEQCSVMMHCSGCRKTLCASCAFDRPYLRNKNAPEEERSKFWWAPGCAVSPCSMQDQDLPPPGPNNNNNQAGNPNGLPSIKFKWCCTEPVFSGGGGITFGNGSNRETDRIRAAPLPQGQGWEEKEFVESHEHSDGAPEHCEGCQKSAGDHTTALSLAGRWATLDDFFQYQNQSVANEINPPTISVPRILCDECYTSEQWKVKCKGCNNALCLKHDVRDRLKVRVCGYKDLVQEKQDFRSRQKAMKILGTIIHHEKDKKATTKTIPLRPTPELAILASSSSAPHGPTPVGQAQNFMPPLAPADTTVPAPVLNESIVAEAAAMQAEVGALLSTLRGPNGTFDHQQRPNSPGSSTSGAASRSSSPTPSATSLPATPEPKSIPRRSRKPPVSVPKWTGCQSFFCPATRPPGDHRRRCVAVMRQCTECKTHVCGDCAATFEPPCPCKGCQVPQAEDGSMQTNMEPALFFCPNCRWDRMASGKCKRRTEAFLDAQAASKRKGKRRKDKLKKPVEQRRGSASSSGGLTGAEMDEAMDGLVDFFFTSLGTQDLPSGLPGAARELDLDDNGDLQEIEDVGAQARDLIRRIQSLRMQFRPGSIAARALPDVRFEDISTDNAGAVTANELSSSEEEVGTQGMEV